MKKFLFLLFIVVSFGFVGHSQTNSFNYDVNGDGVVTIADVTAIYNYLLIGNDVHEYVDLALPSGTLWATTNVGASSPEEYGDYFAWGETQPKNVYSWSTYQWCNGSLETLTKYCSISEFGYNGYVDTKTELDPEDDAATANWGRAWRMPSLDQVQELIESCTCQCTTKNGVWGMMFTSNYNGAILFFPAAGMYQNSQVDNAGGLGLYWERTLNTSGPYGAGNMNFGITRASVINGSHGRSLGVSVRAVRVPLN